MKDYKRFIGAFAALLAVYIIAELNRPKPLDWEITLSRYDKNPYGAYCLYSMLSAVFPKAAIQSYNASSGSASGVHTACLLMAPSLVNVSKKEMSRLLRYAAAGNYLFLCSSAFSKALQDTLQFSTDIRFAFGPGDSTSINFNNPLLRSRKNIFFKPMTLDRYFKKIDTLKTAVLGSNQLQDANFVKMPFGKGTVFIHLLPLCFSNDFLLTRNNASYTAKALSHIPADISSVFWNEYYQSPATESGSPLRFILKDAYLSWAFRLGLFTMLLFVLFGIKRRQRMIPVIAPLQNSTLDFVKTVGNIYFNQQDNKNIAGKMTAYWMEYVRSHFFLPTNVLDESFVQSLAKKTGAPQQEVEALIKLLGTVQTADAVSDQQLLQLNRQLDYFYQTVKQ